MTETTTFRYDPTDSAAFAERSHEIYRQLHDEHPLYADPQGRYWALSRFEDVRSANARLGDVLVDRQGRAPVPKADDVLVRPAPPRRAARSRQPRVHTTPGRRDGTADPPRRHVADRRVRRARRVRRHRRLRRPAAVDRHGPPRRHPRPAHPRLPGAHRRVHAPHLGERRRRAGGAQRRDLRRPLAERRRRPADDLLSALLAAEIDGQRLTEDQLLGFGWLLLVGGNDTTTNLIANGLELLARHPDQRRDLIDDPGLIPDAVEEVLRYAPPTHSLRGPPPATSPSTAASSRPAAA